MYMMVMTTNDSKKKRSQQNDISPGITPLRIHIHSRLGEKQLNIPPITNSKLPTVAGRRQPNMFTGWLQNNPKNTDKCCTFCKKLRHRNAVRTVSIIRDHKWCSFCVIWETVFAT